MEGSKYWEGKTINEKYIQKLREVDRGANGRDYEILYGMV